MAIVRTTSTSFISGTGLKKCSPMKRSGRLVAVNSSVIEMEEVFEAKIASFFTMPSSAAYIFFFSSTFSMTASMTMSQSARSCMLVVPLSRARTACGVSLMRALLGELRQRLLDPGKTFVEKLLLDFEHGDVEPGRGRDLRDARAHQPATENTTFLISI